MGGVNLVPKKRAEFWAICNVTGEISSVSKPHKLQRRKEGKKEAHCLEKPKQESEKREGDTDTHTDTQTMSGTVPSDEELKELVRKELSKPGVDMNTLTQKGVRTALSAALGGVDLKPKKAVIKDAIIAFISAQQPKEEEEEEEGEEQEEEEEEEEMAEEDDGMNLSDSDIEDAPPRRKAPKKTKKKASAAKKTSTQSRSSKGSSKGRASANSDASTGRLYKYNVELTELDEINKSQSSCDVGGGGAGRV